MEIKLAVFNGTFVRTDTCPKEEMPEYAFIGRSNVGKSSLINYLCNYKGLAKVSGTPGKTQTINYFLINNHWHLVDLAGFGYARTSKTNKATWGVMTQHYLRNREQLQYVFLLIDCRIPPQKIDLEFTDFLGGHNIPFVIVFTKCDKPNSPEYQKNMDAFRKEMLKKWEDLPPIFVTSSEKRQGKEAVLAFIGAANKDYQENV